MQYGLVIIGAGQAAAQCAIKAREKGFQGSILVVGNEAYFPYQRPPLSKKYLSGDIHKDDLLIYPESLYHAKNIEFKLEQSVTAIHPASKTLELKSGECLSYDHLVIATGSRANRLPDAVLPHLNNTFVFRGIDDCHEIQSHFQAGKTLVILGGGYIGLELAAVAKNRGLNVILVEKSQRILQRVASEATSQYIRNTHEQHGVLILENSNVEKFNFNKDHLESILLESGEKIGLDLLVIGIGVTANFELAEACGVEIKNRAIWVNHKCETNIPNIYAIGDCTCFDLDGKFTRLESIQNANEQADVVAAQLNKLNAQYKPVPWFWSDQYNLKLQISGLGRDYNRVLSRIDKSKSLASFWYFDNDVLIAVDAVNDPRAYMFSKKFLGKVIINSNLLEDIGVDIKTILV